MSEASANASEFEFYEGDPDVDEVQELKGITDEISTMTFTGLSFPCMVIKENFSCPKHRMMVISNMVKQRSLDKDICLYFSQSGELFKLGSISGQQIKVLIDIIGKEFLEGFLDAKTKLCDDMLYVLYA